MKLAMMKSNMGQRKMAKQINTVGDLVGSFFDAIGFLCKMIIVLGIVAIISGIGITIYDYVSGNHYKHDCLVQEGKWKELPKGDIICLAKDGKFISVKD